MSFRDEIYAARKKTKDKTSFREQIYAARSENAKSSGESQPSLSAEKTVPIKFTDGVVRNVPQSAFDKIRREAATPSPQKVMRDFAFAKDFASQMQSAKGKMQSEKDRRDAAVRNNYAERIQEERDAKYADYDIKGAEKRLNNSDYWMQRVVENRKAGRGFAGDNAIAAERDALEKEIANARAAKERNRVRSFARIPQNADFEQYSTGGFYGSYDPRTVNPARYGEMTDEEVKVWRYLANAKRETQNAELPGTEEYLQSLEDELTQRRGVKMGVKARTIDNPIGRGAAALGLAALSGIKSPIEGTVAAITGEETEPGVLDYAAGYVRNDIDGALGVAYDLTQSTANMVPSILLGSLTGVPVLGTASMGVSAAGNAYSDALRDGYSKGQARLYGGIIGASEAALQNILGGIGALGGKRSVSNVLKKLVEKIPKAGLRAAVKLAGSEASEFSEEALQTYIEAGLRNVIFDENFNLRDVSEDALYSGMLGALSAGVFEAPGVVAQEVQNAKGKMQNESSTEKDSALAGASASLRFDSASGYAQNDTGAENGKIPPPSSDGPPPFRAREAEEERGLNTGVAPGTDLRYNEGSYERGVINGRENEAGDGTGDRGGSSEVLSELEKEGFGRGAGVRSDIHRRALSLKNEISDERISEADIVEPKEGSVGQYAKMQAEEYGVPCHIVSDEAFAREGIQDDVYSFGGQVYVREGAEGIRQTAYIPHEASHVMKQTNYTPYIEFVGSLPEKVNMSSENTRVELARVARHRGFENIDLTSKQAVDFWDEFNATVYGTIQRAKAQGVDYTEYLGEIFHDLDGYVAEMDALHEDFKAERSNLNAELGRNGGSRSAGYSGNMEETESGEGLRYGTGLGNGASDGGADDASGRITAPFGESGTRKNYIKKATGYGQHGVQAFADVMETLPESEASLAARVFHSAYEAGRTNLSPKLAELKTDVQIKAFEAGLKDYNAETKLKEDEVTSRLEEKEKKKREVMAQCGLSEDEANAVVKYKEPEAYKINAKLREDENLLDETQKKTVEFLDSALEKLPKHKGKAFRTVSFDDMFDAEEEYNTFLEEHTVGAVVEYGAYTSASKVLDGHPMDENTKYGITLEIDGESARDVDGFGNNFEKEVIFPRGTIFAVTEVGTDNNGRPYIKVKEIKANGQMDATTEEQSEILQQVQTEEEFHSDVREISERNTSRSFDTKNSVQGVRADKVNDPQNKVVEAKTKLKANNSTGKIKKHKDGDVEYMREAKEDHSDQWTAKRVGDKNKKPKSLSEIIEDIRYDFGVNITTGHIREKDVRGTHTRGINGIRTKKALDLPTVAHELGHNIDEKYGLRDGISEEMKNELVNQLEDELKKKYPTNKLVGEGIAEYVRKFLQNRETAAIDYPLFTNYFLGSMTGRELAQIEQLADEVNAYYSLDADTATSSIKLYGSKAPDARTVSEKAKAKTGAMYQAWVDANHGIKRFDLATGADTYKLATNAAYADAIAGNMISGGDLTDANGKYVAPGLLTALHGLDLHNEADYLLFGEYLTVKHGPERLKEGMRTFSDDRKNSTAWMNNRQAEIERQHPEFVEISERLYDFWDKFTRTWGVNTGLIDEGTYNSWRERWEYYVPFNRVVGQDGVTQGAKRGFANQNSTIKKAHGSGKDVIHPVDNMIVNLVKMVNAGVRNNVMVQITTQAKELKADASFLEQVPMPLSAKTFDMTEVKEKLTEMFEMGGMNVKDEQIATNIVDSLDDILIQYGRGKAHGDVIFVLKNGQPEAWKINDVGMLKSLTSMSPHTMDGILDAYAVVSRFLTSNITGNNLIWSIFSNFPRDMMTLFTYSKSKNPVKVISGVGSAYINKVKGNNADPFYKEFLALGGGQTSEYTADRKLTRNARKKLARKAGKGLEKVNWNPLDWIGFVGNTVESGPRYATYKICREKGMSPQDAFYEAMDITVNFRRGGTVSRELNKIIPFFNANVQGLDKFRRWITVEELAGQTNRKKAVTYRAISFIAVSAALGALVYALNNGEDEKEKEYEQLSNYIKNSYWNIPLGDGQYFAIPKPRELGVLSSFFETCMEYGIGDNDHAFDEFYAYASENLLPAIANDIAQVRSKGFVETGMNIIGSLGIIGVVGYLGANRDFLGRPIVSSGLQNLEPKDQYTDRTSKIAYWVGQATNGSPQQIDYFFQQILGGWWKTQKALFPVGGENVDKTLGVRNTYIKDNQYSTDLTNWLYDRADKTARAKKSNPTDIDKAISAKWDSNMTQFYGTYYKQAKNKSDTTATRGTRQLVLDMILEYQKCIDNDYKTKTQKAVEKVCKEQNSTEFLPSVMPVEVKDGKDKKHTLSDVQYVEYQTDYLRLYWETIEEALPDAQSATERERIITAAKRVAKEQATERTLNRIAAPSSDFTKKYGSVSNGHLVDFFAGISAANANNSLKKSEVVDILSDMDTDSSETWALFMSQNDSYGANYAKNIGVDGNKYVEFLDVLEEVDQPTESGKLGTYTQDEATEAIRSLTGVSNRDRAILWKSVNKNWKDKNNPWARYLP